MRLPYPLDQFGRKMTSQYDEDGIISELIRRLDPPKYFVEFGCHPSECNCLALHIGWPGLFMDPRADEWGNFAKKEFVTPDNVNTLFDKYRVPAEIGVLSIDVDGQELWIWQAIERKAAIVVLEYNAMMGKDVSLTVPRDDQFVWNGSLFQNASLKALDKLGQRKGYVLVYVNGQNCFFVRRELFDNADEFNYDEMWRPSIPNHPPDPLGRAFQEYT